MENWWLKSMDKKLKIWQDNWIEQVELYRISFSNVVIFKNKSFLFNFDCCNFSSTTYRSSHQRCSVTKSVLWNFAKFTRKHLFQSLFFNKVAGQRCSVTKAVPRIFANFTGKQLYQSLFFNNNKKKRFWH